jgi:aryl-alcohol dehydrogenase-like predicted oxidoreductase
MPSSRAYPVERRNVPGRGYDLSAITLDLAATPVATEFSRQSAIAAIRRARAAGVTTFDLANAPNPPLLESVLAEAFTLEDPEVVTILGRPTAPDRPVVRPVSTPAAGAGDGLATLRGSLRDSLHRLGRNHRVIVEWTADAAAPATPEVLSELERSRSEGEVLDYALRRSAADPRPDELRAARVGLASVDLSLVRTEALGALGSTVTDAHPGWIARDVFAGGLLDGSASLAGPRGPELRVGPSRIGELRARFEPVLALGFLTERGERTLAQAAVRFALRWPWVVSASIPLPPVDRFEEVLGYARAPEITETELSRLFRRPRPSTGFPGLPDGPRGRELKNG